MARPGEDVYCTLLMSDVYLPGASVLSHSLRDSGTKKKLACLITLDTLSAATITELRELYDYLIPVERIINPHPANLYSMQRPDLLFAFTKIALWRQIQFRKIVYIDADVVALRAPDELFDIQASFAAAPDIGWPDAFNTGVMVISPNMGDYWALQTLAASGDSFDGADQGLLNQYYEHRGWERISFTYNCTPNAEYQWEPAYRYYKSRISMVHFIGTDKPWIRGRHVRGPGVYSDLLSRWWAVHDRHLKLDSTPQAPQPTPGVAERYVESEHREEQQVEQSAPLPPPEAPPVSTEAPFSEPGERAENIDQGKEEPVPTAEQRRFSAHQMQWDAPRYEPPQESKPEAANFPSQTYDFSKSRELFHAPAAYPEPPKDMWYDVPAEKPAPQVAPKPIFPWERERGPQKPTRIFAEDLPSPESPKVSTPTLTLTPTREEGDDRSNTPTPQEIVQEDPMAQHAFAPTKNAWDDVAGIERYVRAVLGAQTKAKPTAPSVPAGIEGMGITSPTSEAPGQTTDEARSARQQRRESLILTDFPSAVERPSLPVTPAPIRRPSFWGAERDDRGNLPSAEGVPDQFDWDPEKQLESLRRASLIEFESLSHIDPSTIISPTREMPAHSVPTPPPSGKLAPKVPMSPPEKDEGEAEIKAPVAQREFPTTTAVTSAVEEDPPSEGKLTFMEPAFAKEAGQQDVGVEHIESAGPVREEVKDPTDS